MSKASPGFPGFKDGRQALIPIPAEFFSDLLPQIDHLGELQVTLYAFWVLARREGTFRYLSKREMAQDEHLMTAMTTSGLTPEAALEEALERAVTRGTLLHVGLEFDQGVEDFYFVNSAKGRAAVAAAVSGAWSPSGDPLTPFPWSPNGRTSILFMNRTSVR